MGTVFYAIDKAGGRKFCLGKCFDAEDVWGENIQPIDRHRVRVERCFTLDGLHDAIRDPYAWWEAKHIRALHEFLNSCKGDPYVVGDCAMDESEDALDEVDPWGRAPESGGGT